MKNKLKGKRIEIEDFNGPKKCEYSATNEVVEIGIENFVETTFEWGYVRELFKAISKQIKICDDVEMLKDKDVSNMICQYLKILSQDVDTQIEATVLKAATQLIKEYYNENNW